MIRLRSSVSNRRVTMGRMVRKTAWKMIRASAGDLIRIPVMVARCIMDEGRIGGGQSRYDIQIGLFNGISHDIYFHRTQEKSSTDGVCGVTT